MNQAILVLNAGSSSIKFGLYTAADSLDLLWRGQVEAIGSAQARLLANQPGGEHIARRLETPDHPTALQHLLAWMEEVMDKRTLSAVGHRVVHGGRQFSTPVRITPGVLQQLDDLTSLAPLHQPHNLLGIKLLAQSYPRLPQIACFDTAFHHNIPEVARLFALPRELTERGICRYGFHGLSYEYIAETLPAHCGSAADGRVVVAHLGHGVSLCALQHGASIATTMSFSPLDGIPMATRSGALDPSVVFYLQRSMNMSIDEIEQLLNHRAGLLGVSGQSADVRALLESTHPDARLALDLFVYHTVRSVGSLAAALGGLDALVFTAGIGEHAIPIRERICRGCEWLGVQLDAGANARHDVQISRPESPVSAWVIPTDEEQMIARHTWRQINT
ncbi:acetate/propionate family kinase [Thiohalophilus sp.]|uniref:acetate/propionate family kinase n=1 Tax=Thiohalophilus sp. TaxID=3028392 RepID=UPI002ACE4F75|nr:acetate/propionate family kinase [Thiohalophilus sp.]MDZ7805462.1 acetate/propionate family kinase [Thiohalophilus sp.]